MDNVPSELQAVMETPETKEDLKPQTEARKEMQKRPQKLRLISISVGTRDDSMYCTLKDDTLNIKNML